MTSCMTSLNTICQNMKLKLVKMIKTFVKTLELLGDRLEVCVSVLERLIRNAVMSHCIDNNIFSDSQYGFRNRRGCTLQLLKVLDDWTKAIDNGIPVDTLYLDLQKAFDFVPHKRLILKLERLGITGNLLRWIKNFFSERKLRVVLNGISSDWTDVISGVPQGSVLGPILFILYVNDLPNKVKSYCKIFADDTKLYKEINNLKDYEDLQDDIYELYRLTTKWLLFLMPINVKFSI